MHVSVTVTVIWTTGHTTLTRRGTCTCVVLYHQPTATARSTSVMFTTSSLFLKALADTGITHAFVNWGSDHPALLEDLERQRVQGQGQGRSLNGTTTTSGTKPEIVTCPNEMVALSAAQGYAQVVGRPAAVIVHVDVGTQVRF